MNDDDMMMKSSVHMPHLCLSLGGALVVVCVDVVSDFSLFLCHYFFFPRVFSSSFFLPNVFFGRLFSHCFFFFFMCVFVCVLGGKRKRAMHVYSRKNIFPYRYIFFRLLSFDLGLCVILTLPNSVDACCKVCGRAFTAPRPPPGHP